MLTYCMLAPNSWPIWSLNALANSRLINTALSSSEKRSNDYSPRWRSLRAASALLRRRRLAAARRRRLLARRGFLARHLAPGAPRLGRANRDCLLPARHLPARSTALQLSALPLVHRPFNFLRCLLAVLRHRSSSCSVSAV